MSRTFDARQLVLELEGSGKPLESWPTTALLCILRSKLLLPPWLAPSPDERLTLLTRVAALLEERGVDVSSVIRFGLHDRLLHAFITGIVVDRLTRRFEGGTSDADSVEPASDGGEAALLRVWADSDRRSTAEGLREGRTESGPDYLMFDEEEAPFLLATQSAIADGPVEPAEVEVDELRELRVMSVGEAIRLLTTPASIRRMAAWIMSAPLSVLLAWRPVDTSTSNAPMWPDNRELRVMYRWLVDRMTVTYLSRWNTESLHLEWRWMHDGMPAPFDLAILKERTIDDVCLNAEIARRAVHRKRDRTLPLDQAKDRALDLMRAGDRSSAAQLFKEVCDRQPENAEAHNNLGFCILPDDPTEALIHLYRGRDLGYEPPLTIALNLMQADLMTGRTRLAVEIAQRIWDDWNGYSPKIGSWHWDMSSEPRPVLIKDQRLPILFLAAEAAARQGLPTAEDWTARHDRLCPDAATGCQCRLLVPSQ